VVRAQRKHILLRQSIVASERTTKKTAVPSIVACESVATQRPSSVDVVGPQRARLLIRIRTLRIGINGELEEWNMV
jgi:hypothetical protein